MWHRKKELAKKYLDLIAEIDKALRDEEVQKDSELVDTLVSHRKRLVNNEAYNLICARLSKYLLTYIRIHKFKCPKVISDLYYYIAHTAAMYKGTALFALSFAFY